MKDQTHLLWGKAGVNRFNELTWSPLYIHLLDTAHVADQLVQQWIPESVFTKIAADCQLSPSDFSVIIAFLAGIHDLGKATPAFQSKPLREARTTHLRARFLLSKTHPDAATLTAHECAQLPHNLASHILLRRWLEKRYQWSVSSCNAFATPLSAHHGIFASSAFDFSTQEYLIGGPEWMSLQNDLIDLVASKFDPSEILKHEFILSPPAQVFATSIIIVADWIASDVSLFNLYRDGEVEIGDLDFTKRATSALERIDLPMPWEPSATGLSIDERLRERFDFPTHAKANATQATLNELCESNQEPELYIVESPTGVGKTEAALLAAETLAHKFGMAGVTFALPTQATTDAMFTRVQKWIGGMANSEATQNGLDVQLSHGKARFNDLFEKVPYGTDVFDVHDSHAEDEPSITRNLWSSRPKLALLANFTVATIDQVLVAALRTRHNVLRHVGLLRKVLIVDEVHAADTFMRQYLLKVLEWAGSYGIPVICLSATLPSSIRQQLLAAYNTGKSVSPCKPADEPLDRLACLLARSAMPKLGASGEPNAPKLPAPTQHPYPGISFTTKGSIKSVEILENIEPRVFKIELADLTISEIVAKLGQLLSDGGRALIIRNTVGLAVETYRAIDAHFPNEVILSHSRFTTAHRNQNDSVLLQQLGKTARDLSGERKIVVSTQVAEQSLDIDADVLFTDIAPSDLLLQRLGRLHRHGSRARPTKLARPHCFILGVQASTDQGPLISKNNSRIYDESLLLNTASILSVNNQAPQIRVPQQVQELVEQTYDRCPSVASEVWSERLSEARDRFQFNEEQRARRAQQAAIPSCTSTQNLWGFSSTQNDSRTEEKVVAQVRDMQESIEAIIIFSSDGGYRLAYPPPGVESELSLDTVPSSDQARWLARSTVRIPGYVVGEATLTAFPNQLENFYPEAWQVSPDLRNQLFLVLRQDSDTKLGEYYVKYTRELGLELMRNAF